MILAFVYNKVMANNSKKRGFTIIEVVLVLAIAGLIFLMVFVALPALQRSQRNAQRKNDLSRFATAVVEYQKHNNGKLPMESDGTNKKHTFDANFVKRYIDGSCSVGVAVKGNSIAKVASAGGLYKFDDCGQQFTDPDGTTYYLAFLDGTRPSLYNGPHNARRKDIKLKGDYDHVIYFNTYTSCGGSEGELLASDGARDFAMIMALEGGSFTCVDNQ